MDKKLLVIDGNSIINRAFYAIRALTNKEGIPTNGIFGFLNIYCKQVELLAPDYVAVAFDLPAPTFRHKEYEGYKAQRKGMPDELRQQMPILKELLSAMRVAQLEMEGFEADDIIGTVSRFCEEKGIKCLILTGDRDDLQLATDKTVIKLVTTKDGTVDYDDKAVFEKYGVTPHELIEVKALMGDSSDNIPGVPGIGEKTALRLIAEYHSIDNLYEKLEEATLTPSVRKKLEEGQESAVMSRRLATIVRDVPITLTEERMQLRPWNTEELLPLARNLQLNLLIQQIEDNTPAAAKADWETVYAKGKEKGLLFYHDGCAAADTESFAAVPDPAALFCDREIKTVCHDLKALLTKGMTVENCVFDTMIAAYLTDPATKDYSVKNLCGQFLGKGTEGACGVAALYAHLTARLAEDGMGKLYTEAEFPLIPCLAQMEKTGMLVDRGMLEQFGEMLSGKIETLTQKIYLLAEEEFNIQSPKQLGQILFEKLELPHGKGTKTGYSTNNEVLEWLRGKHAIIEYIIEYRALTKLKGTYAEGLKKVISPETGRIHSRFHQNATVTGRLSSSDPNLQNIPVRTKLGSEMRRMFIARQPDYVLIDADYSQIELRILAHMADDKAMQQAFLEGEDIHTATAARVFGVSPEEVTPRMRSRAKAVNFGIVYGIGEFSLSQDLHITRKEAKSYIEGYLNTYSGVRRYMEETVQKAQELGYVTTLFGRRRYIPELKSSNHNLRAFGQRSAMNAPIQGTAADIMKIAMVKVFERLQGMRSRLVLQVHDELIVEAHRSEAEVVKKIVKEEMEKAAVLSVPLTVEINEGENWYDAK